MENSTYLQQKFPGGSCGFGRRYWRTGGIGSESVDLLHCQCIAKRCKLGPSGLSLPLLPAYRNLVECVLCKKIRPHKANGAWNYADYLCYLQSIEPYSGA